MSIRTLVLLALAAGLASGSAGAQRRERIERVELAIVDRDAGESLPRYAWRGQTWVPGAPGHRYAVRLANRGPSRVLVVLSVDGVNAVSGQTASTDQAGYVLEPYATAEIAGWRKSLHDVAQFRFVDAGDSYASRTGRPRNVGVVGIAVFDEASRMPPALVERRAADAAAPAASAPARSNAQALGTGHGDREYSPASRTGFVRASGTPVQVSELRYDDAQVLIARGIIPDPDERAEPRAFPAGFVPDPPRGW